MTRVAITGGAGFIGSNFVHFLRAAHPDWELAVIDKLTYAGNLKNLTPALDDAGFAFFRRDIADPELAAILSGCDTLVHFAAESHVDRSIEDAADFVETNVRGTWRLIEAARHSHVRRFLHVSTDEVYGSAAEGQRFTEASPLAPSSPYAATKAASDLLVSSAIRTHGFPAIITRCCNNYGPFQFPEKFIPLMIVQAFSGEPLPIYGNGTNVRDWIHVRDHCRALELVLREGRTGEVYNIGADCERQNLEVARRILQLTGRPQTLAQFVSDRPGHDLRYALDTGKLRRELGWRPEMGFEDGLAETIHWYRTHSEWIEETRSGAYRDYFDRHYRRREETLAALKNQRAG